MGIAHQWSVVELQWIGQWTGPPQVHQGAGDPADPREARFLRGPRNSFHCDACRPFSPSGSGLEESGAPGRTTAPRGLVLQSSSMRTLPRSSNPLSPRRLSGATFCESGAQPVAVSPWTYIPAISRPTHRRYGVECFSNLLTISTAASTALYWETSALPMVRVTGTPGRETLTDGRRAGTRRAPPRMTSSMERRPCGSYNSHA